MTITLAIVEKKSDSTVSIVSPSVLGMPFPIARIKEATGRSNKYYQYFWSRMNFKGSEVDVMMNEVIEQAVEKKQVSLYCECGDVATCHGQTIRDYLEWELRKKGFNIKRK